MCWLETFKAKFGRYTEATATIESTEVILRDFLRAVPQPYRKLSVVLPTSMTGSKPGQIRHSGEDNDEDPEPDDGNISSGPDPEEAPVLGDTVSLVSEETVGPVLAPEEVDRTVPASLSNGEAIHGELLAKEATLEKKLGKSIRLAVDWSFADHPAFSRLGSEEKAAKSLAIVFGYCTKAVLGAQGLVGACERSPVLKQAILR